MRFFICAALITAVVCTANFTGTSAAPASIGESEAKVKRNTTDGDKEKDDILSTVANAAKLIAQYGCPIARLAHTQCNKEQNQGGYDQKLMQATWDQATKDVDQNDRATVLKAIQEYGCPAVSFVNKLCVLA